jgi:murein DD-endopeptidase MepM/ murein hydrolase activator NlpD
MAYCDVRLGQLFKVYIDGVPLDLASRLLPLKTRLNFSLMTHLHLHAAAQQRYSDKALNKAAVSGQVSKTAFTALIESLQSTVRKLAWKPGPNYKLTFEYLRNHTTRDLYSHIFSLNGFVQTRIDTVPFRYERFVTQAVINQSLFVSLQGMDADPELANRLTAIFGWDIDFFKDIRKGDTFSILYEKKVYENGRTLLGDVLAARIVCQGYEHNAFRYQSRDGFANYFDEQGKSLQKSLLRAPLEYSRVSSNFSYHRFHPVKRHYAPHMGVDYAAPYGTPVRATGDGTVAEATRQAGNGNYVKIRHNSRYETYYLHLSRFGQGVRAGTHVSQGQVIGYVGSTGVSTGPHLDYRIKENGAFVNPRTIQLPSKEPVPPAEMASYDKLKNACLVGLLDARIQNETVCLGKSAPVKPHRAERLF